MKIRLSEVAVRDLENIRDFIATDKPEAALETVQNLLVAIERLSTFPQVGRSGPFGTRQLVKPPFIVVYRIVEDVVSVDAVLHESKRYPD
jgi:toxin ParE1/3/4